MTDPISDMLIRLKNAARAGHETAALPYSQLKHEIAKVLERAGILSAIIRKGKKEKRVLEVAFVVSDRGPAIHGVKLLSKPSRRLYAGYRTFRKSPRGGVIILSTPKGVMSTEEAKKEKVGGQFIAEVW